MTEMQSLYDIEETIHDSSPNLGLDMVRKELTRLLNEYDKKMWATDGSWYRYTLVGKVEFLREFLERKKSNTKVN